MNCFSRLNLLIGFLMVVLAGTGHAQRTGPQPVEVYKITIRHVGPPAVSDSFIKANMRIEAGTVYDRVIGLPNAINDDVRSLYATGYFYNIEVQEDNSAPEKGVHLIFLLQGNPLLTDIRFVGNKKFSDAKLKRTITSKIGLPMSEPQLFKDSLEIKELYQKKGYTSTTVEYQRSIDEANGRAVATFTITEGAKIRIEAVIFEGAKAFPQSGIKSWFGKGLQWKIKTRKWWWLSWLTGSGVFKEEQFQEDKERLAEFYHEKGYLDFEIKDIQFDYPKTNRMVIKFQVFEGQQYKVGAVGFNGNTLISSNALMARLRLKPGDTFEPPKLFEDLETLQDAYGSLGYIDATVRPKQSPNVTTGNMDLVYDFTEGQKIFIERIEIRGNTKTKDKVIRRELAVTPGEVFNKVYVKVSTNRLGQLGYFSKITSEDEKTDLPNRRNLVINVEEKSTGNIQLGAGFSSIDSLVGFVEVSQSNFDMFNPPYFTGGGQKITMRVQLGTERSDYVLSFQEPWMFDRKLIFDTQLFHRNLGYESTEYNQIETGLNASLTRPLFFERLRGSMGYRIQRVTINDVSENASPAIKSQEGSLLISEMNFKLDLDMRGPGLLPDHGYRTVFRTALAGGPFGGDSSFYRLEMRHAHYFPGFAKGHVIEVLARGGVVVPYGDTSSVPIYEQNFLGGAFNMRGFDYREVGPKDSTGEPLGGGTYWFGSAEYSIPIIERVRFAVFYDVGMVYQKPYSLDSNVYDTNGNYLFNTGLFNDDFGFGLRLNLPIGPLVFDYGIPLRSDQFNGGNGKFQFRAGYQRDF